MLCAEIQDKVGLNTSDLWHCPILPATCVAITCTSLMRFFYLALLFVAISPDHSHWPLFTLASSAQFMDNAVPKK